VSQRSRSLGVVAVGLAAAATLFLVGGASTPAPGPPDSAVRAAATIDAKLREAAAGLHARATTLADLPRLAVAVVTDAATVQDLTHDELAFSLKPNEIIEIGQIDAKGKPVSLLRIPKGAAVAPPLDRTGVWLLAAPGGVEVSEVVAIVPSVTSDVQRGALAVSWLVEAQPLIAVLDGIGGPARLEVDGKPVAATRTPIPDSAALASVPLPSELARGATLVVARAAPSRLSALRIAALAIAALAFVVAAALWPRRAAAASSPLPAIAPPMSPALATAAGAAAQSFGRYQLVRKLGAGGMAEVYLARVTGEAGFVKDVALKIMHRDMAQNPEVIDHFLDEARLATRLNHPNIVQIIDLGKQGDDYFIAMEYVEGYDLDYVRHACRQRGVHVPVPVALAIARKVCDGLHAAHTAIAADGTPLDLVHRDVKAGNVLISRKGEVKISDFGIAKANQRTRQTQLGMVKGTAAYMAPEHRMGRPVDRRADVYGAGAILYELLAGEEVNLDLEALAHLGIDGWPHLTPLPRLRADVPPEIDALVFTALAYDRDQRYPTCAAFEDAIDAFATRHNLIASDKMLLQWLEREIAALQRAATS
jgi:hypothetical protein